ncbi:MAG: hypothetical protein ACLR6J_05580 [Parabacteroides merdae]
MQVVLDMKGWGGLPEKYNGVSDASIRHPMKTQRGYLCGRPLDAWSARWKNRGMGVWNDKRQYPLDTPMA